MPVRAAHDATSAKAAWRVLPIQLGRAAIILCAAALVFFLLGFTTGGGGGTALGVVFGVVVGIPVLVGFTVVVVTVIGVPLRLIGPVRRCWGRRTALMPAVIGIGKLLILASFATGSTELLTDPDLPGSPPFASYDPNMPLLGIGWFLLAFGAVHLWWPRPRKQPPAQPPNRWQRYTGP